MTKKEALKKLLKQISDTADEMTKGKTCWHGKEAVEIALIEVVGDLLSNFLDDDPTVVEDDINAILCPEGWEHPINSTGRE